MTVAYELKLLREHFDEATQTHHLHVRLVELGESVGAAHVRSQDSGGPIRIGPETGEPPVLGYGEEFQRSFCFPGHDDDFDFERELEDLKVWLARRYERTKKHKEALNAAVQKHLTK